MSATSDASTTAFPSLTHNWHARARERQVLSNMLRARRLALPGGLLVWGGHGQGKTTLVLDVLCENRAHFAYVDAQLQDRWMVKRLTIQITNKEMGPILFRRLCAHQQEGVDIPLPSKPEQRGKKRKPEATSEIPLHPDAMVEDLPKAAPTSTHGAEATPATAADALAGNTGGIAFQSSSRSQLTELVRSISALRHTAERGSLVSETIYLVIDNAHRLADPGLLASLLALTQHTLYPVTLILISPSLSLPEPAGGYFGLPAHISNAITPLLLRPYAPRELAAILSTKLWRTNRHVAAAFGASFSSPLTPSQLSTSYSLFIDLVDQLVQVFAEPLSNEPARMEQEIRRILPHVLRLVPKILSKPSDLDGSNASSKFTAAIVLSLGSELKERVRNVWKDSADYGSPLQSLQPPKKKQAVGVTTPSTSLTPSSSSNPSVSLPSSFSPLVHLSRTSKLLLLSSFLASYNPASSDTGLFTSSRKAWNRKGKSAAVERKRTAFDSKSAASEAQVGQLELGPNAAPMERVIAIYQAISEDSDSSSSSSHNSGGGGLAASYAQLKNLLATHHLEQVTTGGRNARSGDLLSGVKIRCLVTKAEMEQVCDSIDEKSTSTGQPSRMGEKFTLGMYLYEGAKRK